MSSQSTADAVVTASPSATQTPKKTALERLEALKRALQRQLKRKPTAIEKATLDNTALLMLRAEMAGFDTKADSNTVVRLNNVARRARLDFERLCTPQKRKPTMGNALRQAGLR